jgi:hypothetical protein
MFQPLHLGRRFFRSIHRKGPSAAEEAWATHQLLRTERDLWLSMSDADRRHAVLVAQQVAATLGQQGTRPVLSAALLHDVGKTVSGLSLYGRVIATLIIAVVGRARAATWTRASSGGWLYMRGTRTLEQKCSREPEAIPLRSPGLASTIHPRRPGLCPSRSVASCGQPIKNRLPRAIWTINRLETLPSAPQQARGRSALRPA